MHQTVNAGNHANLEGYWRFDNGSGQTVDDQTSNNNDGVRGNGSGSASNDPTWNLLQTLYWKIMTWEIMILKGYGM